jgi:hypothetical protein
MAYNNKTTLLNTSNRFSVLDTSSGGKRKKIKWVPLDLNAYAEAQRTEARRRGRQHPRRQRARVRVQRGQRMPGKKQFPVLGRPVNTGARWERLKTNYQRPAPVAPVVCPAGAAVAAAEDEYDPDYDLDVLVLTDRGTYFEDPPEELTGRVYDADVMNWDDME